MLRAREARNSGEITKNDKTGHELSALAGTSS